MVVFTGNTPGKVGGTVATIRICLLFLPGTCHHTGKNNLGWKGKSGLPVSLCSQYIPAYPTGL